MVDESASDFVAIVGRGRRKKLTDSRYLTLDAVVRSIFTGLVGI